MTDKRKESYRILEFIDDPNTAIITGLQIRLFPFVGKDERITHVTYAILLSGKKEIMQIAIQGMNINRSLAIVKSILSPSQLKAMDKKGYFGEQRKAEIRQRVLTSSYTKGAMEYAAQNWNFDRNDLREYIIGLLV